MKKLLLIDGHALIHRAYHAYPQILAAKTGEPTNAVYGFTNILLTAIGELSPTHIAIAFDLPQPTFRHSIFEGYKKSRVKPEDRLIAQIPRVKEVVATLNIPAFAVEGFEADDLIGTLARQAISNSQLTVNVTILTSDRDLMQLIIGGQVVIKMPERRQSRLKRSNLSRRGQALTGEIWNEVRFTSEWGFSPRLLIDYKSLAGDHSDDIPGVKGIGKITAQKLIAEFGEVNQIYQNIDQVKDIFGNKVFEKLVQDQGVAQMSKKLATIDTDSPIKLNWEAMAIHDYNKEKIIRLFAELNFKSLIDKLPNDSFEESVQETLF